MNRLQTKSLWCVLILVGAALNPGRAAANDADDIVAYTNLVRVRNNLPPLRVNHRLNLAAQYNARNMADQHTLSNYLDGEGPGDRLSAFGYRWIINAENIASVRGSDDPAAEAMALWLQSPRQRANILSPDVEEIGAAYATAPDGTVYFCVDFASR